MAGGKLDDYAATLRRLGAPGFARAHPHAVLVRAEVVDEESERSFHTHDMRAAEPPRRIEDAALGSEPPIADEVFPIVKREGGAFEDRIGVGRARNADVSLPHPRVSKYHAFFTTSEDGAQFFLTDAGSRNGTWIGLRRLPDREPFPIDDGTDVSFGPYKYRFHTPRGFLKLVEYWAGEPDDD